MIWDFSQVPTNIADDIWVQYGALGLIIIGLVVALVYYVKKTDRIQKEKDEEMRRYDELQEKRLAEARESARVAMIPFEELTKFIRKLYDGSVGRDGN